jgi:hypothetical protein
MHLIAIMEMTRPGARWALGGGESQGGIAAEKFAADRVAVG